MHNLTCTQTANNNTGAFTVAPALSCRAGNKTARYAALGLHQGYEDAGCILGRRKLSARGHAAEAGRHWRVCQDAGCQPCATKCTGPVPLCSCVRALQTGSGSSLCLIDQPKRAPSHPSGHCAHEGSLLVQPASNRMLLQRPVSIGTLPWMRSLTSTFMVKDLCQQRGQVVASSAVSQRSAGDRIHSQLSVCRVAWCIQKQHRRRGRYRRPAHPT